MGQRGSCWFVGSHALPWFFLETQLLDVVVHSMVPLIKKNVVKGNWFPAPSIKVNCYFCFDDFFWKAIPGHGVVCKVLRVDKGPLKKQWGRYTFSLSRCFCGDMLFLEIFEHGTTLGIRFLLVSVVKDRADHEDT